MKVRKKLRLQKGLALICAALFLMCGVCCDARPAPTPEPKLFQGPKPCRILVELSGQPEYYVFIDNPVGGWGMSLEHVLLGCAVYFSYAPDLSSSADGNGELISRLLQVKNNWKIRVTFASSVFFNPTVNPTRPYHYKIGRRDEDVLRVLYIGEEIWYLDAWAEGEYDGWGVAGTNTLSTFINTGMLDYGRGLLYLCEYDNGAIPTAPAASPVPFQ